MASDGPEFESKAADILGLYLNPPQHTAVVSIDEKTAIQALDRLDPVLALSPRPAERQGFEHYGHGTLRCRRHWTPRLAASTGKLRLATPAISLRSSKKWWHCARPRQQIRIILDNLSAHKTQLVQDFLQRHSRVQFHFTPTYSSWLNQVELGFAKIEREAIARGIFTSTSVTHLARKLRRYINACSAKMIQNAYTQTPSINATIVGERPPDGVRYEVFKVF